MNCHILQPGMRRLGIDWKKVTLESESIGLLDPSRGVNAGMNRDEKNFFAFAHLRNPFHTGDDRAEILLCARDAEFARQHCRVCNDALS